MSAVSCAALAYARAGRPVFVIGRNKKPMPGQMRARSAATTDISTIEAWFRRWPDANICTLTGSVAGFIVLDVDPRNGGHLSLAALEELHGALPATLTTLTGGGGFHHYFKQPDFPARSIEVAAGVEVKGEKGSITLPPSIHASGKQYIWYGPVRDIAVAPAWLLDLVRPVVRPRCDPATRPSVTNATGYGAVALNGEVHAVRAAADGTRNHQLNRSAFNLGQLVAASVLDESVVVGELLGAALASGLDERESRSTIASGLRGGRAKPRSNLRIGARS